MPSTAALTRGVQPIAATRSKPSRAEPTFSDVRACSERLEDVLCTPVHPGVRIGSPGTIRDYGCHSVGAAAE